MTGNKLWKSAPTKLLKTIKSIVHWGFVPLVVYIALKQDPSLTVMHIINPFAAPAGSRDSYSPGWLVTGSMTIQEKENLDACRYITPKEDGCNSHSAQSSQHNRKAYNDTIILNMQLEIQQ
ncbi:unnamed protein product [Peronospora belbahrii]|uniref:Mitochondrial import receptor subunit TOM7 n=1 Tax=Peronospora belbahrii TaxID=622444 RepID=A0AAU9KVJ9_9STRA|nr:unnamed protein product [Peronospora belbahrii]